MRKIVGAWDRGTHLESEPLCGEFVLVKQGRFAGASGELTFNGGADLNAGTLFDVITGTISTGPAAH